MKTTFVGLLAVLLWTPGCGDDSSPTRSIDDELVGTWEDPDDPSAWVTYRSDGTWQGGDISEGTWEAENETLTLVYAGAGGVFKPIITDGTLSFGLVVPGGLTLEEETLSGQGSKLEDTDWINEDDGSVLRFRSWDGALTGIGLEEFGIEYQWEWDGENVKISIGIALHYEISGDALTLGGDTFDENTLRRQGSFLGSETINSQDNFDKLVAFLDGSPTLEGDLRIEGTDLTQLKGLDDLRKITGRLIIYDNDVLTSLEGLHNVESVGDSVGTERYEDSYFPGTALSIQDNEALMNLQGLRGLKSVGGEVGISGNATLTSLDGLGNVTSIEGFLSIFGNAAMVSLEGLSSLEEIGGYLTVSGNGALASTEGLHSIERIGGDLRIGENALKQVQGFNALRSIGGGFFLERTRALEVLGGFDNLTVVEGPWVSIDRNEALQTIEGLNSLTSVGVGLTITHNPVLSSLEGLGSLTSVGSILKIERTALTSLEGLNNLTSVGRSLDVHSNAALVSLEGLNNLTSVGRHLSIFGNESLTSLDALENLSSVETALFVKGNSALPTSAAQALADRLIAGGFTGEVTIEDNQP